MKLSQYKEKKNHKKLAFVIVAIVFLIGGVTIGITFANFKVQKSFKVMEGNFIYEGSGDVIFAFYNGDENVGTMPTKDSGYVFNSQKSFCDNDAKIKWDKSAWGPTIVNLNKTKTKCNLYFVKAGTLRKINGTSDTEGMWGYKDKLTKLVIETTKNKKVAGAGQVVHGPFDESEKKDSSVESYVVCDTGDTNCIGYLQSNGGIDLNSDSSYLFYNFKNVTQIEGIENLYTSSVIDMKHMFYNMSNLVELDLSSFDTRNVTNMNSMFYNMSNLQTLTFGENFDTRNVTNMINMFGHLMNLQTLNLRTFNTGNVTFMQGMFAYMDTIQELDLSTFDTSNVTTMYDMFAGMSTIQKLDLSNFDTSNVTDMHNMFENMSSIQTLDLRTFNTSNVTNMNRMFANSTNLTEITYGPNFIHKFGSTTGNMFLNCPANQPDENVHSSWKGVSFN